METLRQDVVFALRLLRRDPTYTAAVVLTLALCLGANGAIFTVVRSVLLRPLPYAHADQLVFMYDAFPGAGVERAGTSVPNYVDRAQLTSTFDAVALYQQRGLDAGEAGAVERLLAQQVTPSFFRVLGVSPERGRVFTHQEAQAGNGGKTSLTVISHAYWMRQFGGSADIVGRQVRLNGVPFTVIGVMPANFTFLNPAVRLWTPAAFSPEERGEDERYSQDYDGIARLAAGVTVAQAQAQLDALNARYLERAGPLKQALINAGYRSAVLPLEADIVRNVRAALRLLWGAALLVLLIAAVNIANLALVRTGGRLKELATRYAIGAGRARVTRQLLTETMLLTLAGGALGLGLAWWSLQGLSRLGLDELPRGHEIGLDSVVVLVMIGLAAVLGVAIGAVPALQLAGLNLNVVLRDDSRTATAGRGARLTRRALVAAQVALAFVLLVGAGLLLASFNRLLSVDPGFRPARVLTGRTNLPDSRYSNDAALRGFVERVVQRVRILPGVEGAGVSSNLPFTGNNTSSSVIIPEGYQMVPGESVVSPNRLQVTPGYFEAMSVPLRRGRFFTDSDTAEAARVVIIDEALARKFWPGGDPIGRRMYLPQKPEDVVKPGPSVIWVQVVGVVGAVKLQGLVEGEGARAGAYYFPYAQNPSRGVGLAIRTAGEPVALTAAVRQILTEIDAQLALFDVRTMVERVERSLDRRRTPMLLSLAFAGIAMLLASIGIYGVLAYQVSQRTREIGIRMALGSDARSVVGLVLTEGLVLVCAGLVAGMAGAIALRRAIASELYSIDPLDPVVITVVTVLLGLTSLLACLGPARRAARVNPAVALSN